VKGLGQSSHTEVLREKKKKTVETRKCKLKQQCPILKVKLTKKEKTYARMA
jgi:hypothetical protein